jgi:hypothetical protein
MIQTPGTQCEAFLKGCKTPQTHYSDMNRIENIRTGKDAGIVTFLKDSIRWNRKWIWLHLVQTFRE